MRSWEVIELAILLMVKRPGAQYRNLSSFGGVGKVKVIFLPK